MPNGAGYAGDVDPATAWSGLSEDESAALVDVRTVAEWQFVGLPDLSRLGREAALVSWQVYPEMAQNAAFVEQVKAAGIGEDQTVYLLCRSGQRSIAAATALTAAGYKTCYNVAEGFEGPPDSDGHRGSVAGWKQRGLPWRLR